MSAESSPQRDRGIDLVANLFLSQGNRKTSASGATGDGQDRGTIDRLETKIDSRTNEPRNLEIERNQAEGKPGQAEREPGHIGREPGQAERKTDSDDRQQDNAAAIATLAVLGGDSDNDTQLAVRYAQYVAYHEGPVTLFDTITGMQQIVRPPDESNSSAETQKTPQTTLTQRADAPQTLLIHIREPWLDQTAHLIRRCQQVVVLSECDNDSIVVAYKKLKQINSVIKEQQQIALFVCGSAPTATRIYEKMARAADKFLQIDLISAGHSGLASQ